MTVSQNLLKIFEFSKMFWIANNACDRKLKKLFISFIWFLPRVKNFDAICRKLPQRNPSNI